MADDDEQFVRLPVLKAKAIASDFRKIFAALHACYVVERSPAPRLLAAAVADTLGCKDIKSVRVAVLSSIDDLESPNPDQARLRRVAYRLAVNKERLQLGWAAPSSPASVKPTWTIATITGVERVIAVHKQDAKLHIAWRLLSGKLAGRQFIDRLRHSAGASLYGMCTGFPRGCEFQSPKQLVSLRCGLMIGWREDTFVYECRGISKSLRTSNVKLTRQRNRNLTPCPFGVALDCVFCRVGMNECERSVNNIDTELIGNR